MSSPSHLPASFPAQRKTAPFHLMAKPVGPRCNMACRYCFYTEKEALFPARGDFRMSDRVLEAYIRGIAESQDTTELTYAWQGGEPTLAGIGFFRRAVELQRRYAGGRPVQNALQTNGLALDDEWCEFLARHRFLVGLSLDGPADLQNEYRVDSAGRPQFDRVLRALNTLRKYGVPFNILTVVHRANAARPLEVYRYLRDAGARHLQFIPAVERSPDGAARALGLQLAPPPDLSAEAAAPARVLPWCPAPEAFGDFLVAIFDEWIRRDVGRVFVQTFEVALGQWMGLPAGVCQSAPTCGRALALEHNGDVYACDHYVYPAFRLGNVLESPLADLVDAAAQTRFGDAKRDRLPAVCRACPWLRMCGGDCPKHRILPAGPGEPPVSYLCEGYRRFFEHAAPWLRRLEVLLRAGRPATDIRFEIAALDRQSAGGAAMEARHA